MSFRTLTCTTHYVGVVKRAHTAGVNFDGDGSDPAATTILREQQKILSGRVRPCLVHFTPLPTHTRAVVTGLRRPRRPRRRRRRRRLHSTLFQRAPLLSPPNGCSVVRTNKMDESKDQSM